MIASAMSPPIDPNVPDAFNRAGFYVEKLKYVGGDQSLTGITQEQILEQLDKVLHDAAINSMTAEEVRDKLEDLALNFLANVAPLILKNEISPQIVFRSVLYDGFLYGLAIGAGLEAMSPKPEENN